MSKRSTLFLIRTTPGIVANETIDLILVNGVFEQPTSVLFVDDGVYQLAGHADGSKDTLAMLKALPAYDVEALYADRESLQSRNIESTDIPVEVVDESEITELLHSHDVVIGD